MTKFTECCRLDAVAQTRLWKLIVTQGSFTVPFRSSLYTYRMRTSDGATPTIQAIPLDPYSTIQYTVDIGSRMPMSPLIPIPFTVNGWDVKTITITVTATDGVTKQSYTIYAQKYGTRSKSTHALAYTFTRRS